MFSILHFLQTYQPPSSHSYAAPGAVVLIRLYLAVNFPVMQWPYPDISLQQVAVQECQTLYNSQGDSCAVTNDFSGYFPIYGKRGTDLLPLLTGSQTGAMNQGDQTYAVLARPLLPENLLVQADGKQWTETFGMNGGKWPLLVGAH